MAKNSGTLVIASIRPYDDTDEYATAYSNEKKGGHHQVQDDTERDNIYAGRKQEGMLVTVLSSVSNNNRMTTYMLSGGTWVNSTSANISDLNDVNLTSPTDGEILVYENGTWENDNLDNIYVNKNGDVINGLIYYSSLMTFSSDGDIINKKYVDDEISTINHDDLNGFVANEHVNHSSVSINTSGILSGGGDLTASRTITLNHHD